jgi:hypothetical protein
MATTLVLALVGCSKRLASVGQESKPEHTAEAGQGGLERSSSDGQGTERPKAQVDRRKIVYDGTLDLVVKSFDGLGQQIVELAEKFDGYVAHSNLRGLAGKSRYGEWTLRVPAENYSALMLALEGLGEVRASSSNSQDATAEYYDLEARIRNKKQEEERLLKHLAGSTNRLDEILSIEREIARVRGDVEQLTGRLNLLHDHVTLATLTLRIEEMHAFEPIQAATYGERLGHTWHQSLAALNGLGQIISIVLVGATPWLLALGLVGCGPALFIRRRQRRHGATAT